MNLASPPDDYVKGTSSTARIDALEEAAADLAPHLSLKRLEDTSKFFLAGVALVGAVLTGYGALGSDVVKTHPWAALPSLALAAISVALASWSLVGVGDEVDLDDLEDVEVFYRREISVRTSLVRWAGTSFAGALLLAAIPALVGAGSRKTATTVPPDVAPNVRVIESQTALRVEANANAGQGAAAVLRLSSPGKAAVVRRAADMRGRVSFTVTAERANPQRPIRIQLTVNRIGQSPALTTLTLPG